MHHLHVSPFQVHRCPIQSHFSLSSQIYIGYIGAGHAWNVCSNVALPFSHVTPSQYLLVSGLRAPCLKTICTNFSWASATLFGWCESVWAAENVLAPQQTAAQQAPAGTKALNIVKDTFWHHCILIAICVTCLPDMERKGPVFVT